jgi:hypothetical protein
VLFSLLIPLIYSFLTFSSSSQKLTNVYLITLAISLMAFLVTDRLIDQFKESLEKKGLFGIDLNKAGARETKPKV